MTIFVIMLVAWLAYRWQRKVSRNRRLRLYERAEASIPKYTGPLPVVDDAELARLAKQTGPAWEQDSVWDDVFDDDSYREDDL